MIRPTSRTILLYVSVEHVWPNYDAIIIQSIDVFFLTEFIIISHHQYERAQSTNVLEQQAMALAG